MIILERWGEGGILCNRSPHLLPMHLLLRQRHLLPMTMCKPLQRRPRHHLPMKIWKPLPTTPDGKGVGMLQLKKIQKLEMDSPKGDCTRQKGLALFI